VIKDYSVYELSKREKIKFYSLGYVCVFFIMYLFYRSIIISAVLGISVHWLMPYVKKYLADKRMNALNTQFKDLLYSLSASVASGRQMEEALIEAEENLSIMYGADEPIMKELKHMSISMIQNKESDKELLKDFAFRSKSEDVNNFVQVYITCRSMGGNLEKIIGHTAEIITDKMAIEREIKAMISQKKIEGRIISVMPIFMLLALNICSYSYVALLYTSVAGRIIMTAALGAMVYGTYLMEKISDIEI